MTRFDVMSLLIVGLELLVIAIDFVARGDWDANDETRTRKRYKSTMPTWILFSTKENLVQGEDDFPNLVDGEGQLKKHSRKLLQRWAEHLHKRLDMTHIIWSTSLNFTQETLKQQMAEDYLLDPKGCIRGLPVI